jgi:hypothetical protein
MFTNIATYLTPSAIYILIKISLMSENEEAFPSPGKLSDNTFNLESTQKRPKSQKIRSEIST